MRIGCEVPGCRRTRGDRKDDPVTEGVEWICAEHWIALPKARRRVYARLKRQAKQRPDRVLNLLRAARAWEHLKRIAVLRAGGL